MGTASQDTSPETLALTRGGRWGHARFFALGHLLISLCQLRTLFLKDLLFGVWPIVGFAVGDPSSGVSQAPRLCHGSCATPGTQELRL